jgi:hypothetical protein
VLFPHDDGVLTVSANDEDGDKFNFDTAFFTWINP